MKTEVKLPEFQGKSLIREPKIELADFLVGPFGEAVLEEYQGRAEADYDNNPKLNVLEYKDGVVIGSNPFAVTLVNQIVSQERLRTATPSDLEEILRFNRPDLDLRNYYEDSALVLRPGDGPNPYLAVNLASQIRSRNPNFQFPVMIPLSSLELVKDPDSSYGLSFKLREDAQVIYAPQLDHKNEGKRFNETDEKGLPIFNKDGTRILYTRQDGISRLSLRGDLDLDSDDDGLAYSDEPGRVVVVRGGASQKNLDAYVARLREERRRQEETIRKKFEEAMRILKDN